MIYITRLVINYRTYNKYTETRLINLIERPKRSNLLLGDAYRAIAAVAQGPMMGIDNRDASVEVDVGG